MKANYLLIIISIASLFSMGCKKESIDPIEQIRTLRYANIVDAQSLFVAGEAATRAGGEGEEMPTLYKITVNGETRKIEFIDADGKSVPVMTNYVLNLSKKFVMLNVCVNDWLGRGLSYVFIIRKTDGAMFSPKYGNYGVQFTVFDIFSYPRGYDLYNYFSELQDMQSDKDNNVYFVDRDHSGCIQKIHDDASGNLFVTELTSTTNMRVSPDDYTVNANGDIWFYSRESTGSISYCRFKSGEFIRAPDYYHNLFSLPSQDHNFYRIDRLAGSDYDYMWCLYRYTAQQPEIKEEIVLTGMLDEEPSNYGGDLAQLSDCAIIVYENAVCVIRNESDVKFYNVVFPPNNTQKPYLHYGQYIYHYDNMGNIMRFDSSNGTVETVYANTGYQIKLLCSCSEEVILFMAIELKTGNNVTVEVENGVAKVLDYIDGHKIIQLERLN